jgi:amino acid permease
MSSGLSIKIDKTNIPDSPIAMTEFSQEQTPSHPTTGIIGASFLLCATTLGAGILAIPYAFSVLGIAFGAPLLLLVGIMSISSLWMMLKAGEVSGAKSYEDMVHLAAPGYGRIITVIFMDVLIFGALVGFLVIIGNLIRPVIDHWDPFTRVWYTDTPYLILGFTVVFVFPLSMLRNISMLEYTSFLAVAIIIAFTGILSYQSIKKMVDGEVDWHELVWYPEGKNPKDVLNEVFNVLPIIALAYTCQLSVFPIWKELHQPTVGRMSIVNSITMALSFVLYLAMGFFGYVLYHNHTQSNIIVMIPNDLLSTILRLVFLVAILFHYPVVHFAFRNSLEETVFKNYEFSWIRHTILTLLVVGGSLALAVLPQLNLGNVFNLTGSVAAFPINFIIPSFCFIKLKYYTYKTVNSDDEHDQMLLLNPDGTYQKPRCTLASMCRPGVILPLLLILVSLVFMVLGIYVSILAFIPTK